MAPSNLLSFCTHRYQGVRPRLRKARRSDARGFTLVELMVAILIIAVLIAIAVPMFNKSVYRANKSKSISNLRTMGIALISYVTDNDGYLPQGASQPGFKGRSMYYWYHALDYYITQQDWPGSNWTNTNRPAWQVDPGKRYSDTPMKDGVYAVNVGYGWNHGYFGYTRPSPNPPPPDKPDPYGWGARMLQVEIPSKTIIIGTNKDVDEGLGNVMLYAGAATTRYDNGGLFLLLDGHVQAYTPSQTKENNSYLFRKIKPIP